MKTYAVDASEMAGLSLRLCMLETHYRKDKNFSRSALTRSAKVLRRWLSAAIPNDGPVPVAVLEALCDDLNTPAAIAVMHKLAKSDGMALFAAMKLLGFIPGHERPIDYDIVDGIKTLPIEHIPLLEWPDGATGFVVVGGDRRK